MKDLLKRLKAILKEPIEGYNAMLNFYLDDVLDYYGNVITTPDNIEDFRLLIKEQSYLIEIQQIIYFNNKYNKANKSISYKMSLIQDMINNYDDIMKKSRCCSARTSSSPHQPARGSGNSCNTHWWKCGSSHLRPPAWRTHRSPAHQGQRI